MTDRVSIHAGDCLQVLAGLPECSVDAVVCDPPYGLGFMGKHWDAAENVAFRPETWAAVLRVMKPGGHLVAFSGTRTYHRMVVAIEDAGFEVRDQLAWVYGSGFPKSYNVGQSIEKLQTIGKARRPDRDLGGLSRDRYSGEVDGKLFTDTGGSVEYTTEDGKRWAGFGTALKPAYEPICLARKPLSEGTVAANVLRWGTGALNIDATRIVTSEDLNGGRYSDNKIGNDGATYGSGINKRSANEYAQPTGRWPANLCHDGSEEVLAGFPQTKNGGQNRTSVKGDGMFMDGSSLAGSTNFAGDEGSAARFFYCAKANKTDRAGSKHPTVKPVSLMRWLVRMVTPPGGTVLDPFAGTGTTGQAALEEGFNAILIEREAEYLADIERRFQSVAAE